jgi:hypothetical protein
VCERERETERERERESREREREREREKEREKTERERADRETETDLYTRTHTHLLEGANSRFGEMFAFHQLANLREILVIFNENSISTSKKRDTKREIKKSNFLYKEVQHRPNLQKDVHRTQSTRCQKHALIATF